MLLGAACVLVLGAHAEAHGSSFDHGRATGLVTGGPVYAMAQADGLLYLGGDFDWVGQETGPVVTVSAQTGRRDPGLDHPLRAQDVEPGPGGTTSVRTRIPSRRPGWTR